MTPDDPRIDFDAINREAVALARHTFDQRCLRAFPPGELIFAAIPGGHMYGFPSPDSDLDIRGCHLLPLEDVVGLGTPVETFECMGEEVEGVEIDLVTHDLGKYLRLLLKNGGYVLEQILSPLVVCENERMAELRELARGAMTRNVFHHYGGFFRRQRAIVAREDPLLAKSVLYLFRVVMSGIHLLRSGRLETDIKILNEEFRIGFLPELWTTKATRREKATLPAEDRKNYLAEADRLEELMRDTRSTSPLPEDEKNTAALNDFLVRARMGR